MQRSQKIAGCLIAALMPIASYAGDAFELRGGSVEIQVDQRTVPGRWVVTEPGTTNAPVQSGSLGDDDLAVMMPPGRVARVVVVNAVPMLFDYGLKIGEREETKSFKAAVSFLEQLTPLDRKAAATQRSFADTPQCSMVYGTVELCTLHGSAMELLKFKNEYAAAALSAVLSADEVKVRASKDTLKTMADKLLKLQQDVNALADTDFQASLDSAKGSWKANGLPDGAGTLKQLYDAVRSSGSGPAGFLPYVAAAEGLVKHAESVKLAIAYAVQFSSEYQETFEKLEVKDGDKTLAYDAGHVNPINVLVTADRRFAEVFPSGTQAYQDARVGTYPIRVKPRERLSLSIGAGVIYSFVRDPEFSVAEDAAGVLTVAKKEDDYAEFDGAVVANVTGADWELFGVHPFVQIGIAPSSEHLAVMVGAGLQLYDRGAISIGAIYQRVQRLSPGLSEGQVIDDPDALKTDHEFKAGLYLMLSFNLK